MFRLHKSLTERIYLLSVEQQSQDQWVFKVKGQSKNIYDQRLNPEHFYCSCPDHKTRGTFCKHLLFLVARVAQKTDIASKIQYNFSNWNETNYGLWVEAFKERLKNRVEKSTKHSAGGKDCPICFEEITETEEAIQCITTCKNWLHKSCMDLWLTSGHRSCPMCRAIWVVTENTDIEEINSKIEVTLLEDKSEVTSEVITDVIFEVTEDMSLIDFCASKGLEYKKKNIYYEIVKNEEIEIESIKMMEKTSRNFLNMDSIKEKIVDKIIRKNQYKEYMIFARVNRFNRKVVKGQHILVC